MAHGKGHGHRMSGGRRFLKKAASFGAAFFKAGPVSIPLALEVVGIINGTRPIMNAPRDLVFDISGYDLNTQSLNQAELQAVIFRDVVSEIIGFGLGYVQKHI